MSLGLSELVYKSSSAKTHEELVSKQLRFAGTNLPVPERPIGDGSSSHDARHLIRRYAHKYKSLAYDIHSLEDEDDGEFTTNDDNSTDYRRYKRDVILAGTPNLARSRRKILTPESQGTFVINQVERATPQYFDGTKALDINCQRIDDTSFVFSIEETENGRQLQVHQLNDRTLQQMFSFREPAPEAESVEVFKIKQDYYAFTTVDHEPHGFESLNTISTGSTLYRIHLSNNSFDKTQTIHLPFAKSSEIWAGSGEQAQDLFLAIAPEKAIRETGLTYQVMVPCYRWQGGYFDYVSQVPASNPQSIQHFTMFSHDYLAIANYQDDTGSTSVHSEIFKYQHKEARFTSFQKIQTFGAKDVRHFSFESLDGRRKEHFIAIANHCKKDENGLSHFRVQSTIMKFSENRFFPFKSFWTDGAVQFLPVKKVVFLKLVSDPVYSQQGSSFYLAMADLHGIRILQYNGWNFVETYSFKHSTIQHSPLSIRMRELNNEGKMYFTVASKSTGIENGMYTVGFETRNDHRKLVTAVQTWCFSADRQFKNKDLSSIESQINAAPKVTDSKVVVHGTITFEKGIKVKDLQSRALGLRGRSLGGNEFKTLAMNERRFDTLQRRLGMLHQMKKGVVLVDRDQTIEGNVMLRDAVYENPQLQVGSFNVNKFGSRRVSDGLNNLVFLNQDQSFEKLSVKGVQAHDITSSSLNGHSLSDYALRNPTKTQVFKGTNNFQKDVTILNSINVERMFAGLSFNNPRFLLAQGNQTFPGDTMNLHGSQVKTLYTKVLNFHKVDAYFDNALLLSGGEILVEKHFKKMKIQNAQVESFNNENIDALYAKAIYIDGRSPQSFTGATYLESMEIDEINPANRIINEQFDLTSDFIQIQNGKYNIQNLNILGSTNIDELVVNRRLNNIEVNNGKLDILLANSEEPQHIKSKTLRSIHLRNHVEANGLVDGVHLSSWSEVQRILLPENSIQGALNVKGSIKANDGIFVKDSFTQANSDVSHVLQHSARTDAEQLPGSCTLTFEGLEVLGNSDILGDVNGVHPSDWVINNPTQTQKVHITGEKTFSNGLKLERDIEANALFGSKEANAENILSVLPNLLLDDVDQHITHETAFIRGFRVNQASCMNSILNETPFEDLLHKKGDQTVHVRSSFRKPLIAKGDVGVLADLTVGSVNGININRELEDTLRTGKQPDQTVKGDYHFTELSTQNTFVQGKFASTDVNSLLGNIVMKNKNKVTTLQEGSQLIFSKGGSINLVEYIGSVNGIRHSEWGQKWLLTQSDQKVTSKVEFVYAISVSSVQTSTVNGIDVRQLSSEILRTDRDEVWGGSMEFMREVKATQGITMPNKAIVNGVDLRNEVLLKSSRNVQTVTADKRFLGGMTVNGNLEVDNIEDFSIGTFAKLVSTGEKSLGSSSLTVNGNLEMTNEPEFKTRINNHAWNEIMEQYWFRDKNVVLSQPVQFSKLTLTKGGSLSSSAKLNGMDLEHLQNNYASKTRDQVWSGQVSLKKVEKIQRIEAESIVLENGGVFNGVDIKTFYDSVLRYSGDQSVHGSVKAQKIQTTRLDTTKINSVSVPSDLMTVNGHNNVQATKHFTNIVANSISMSENTVIDGVNLGQWQAHSAKRVGSNVLMGSLEFRTLKILDNVVVDGLVDGMRYDKTTVFTLDQNQDILGHITIKAPESQPHSLALTVPQGVTVEGTMNRININEQMKKIVFKNSQSNSAIVIKGETTFNAPLTLHEVQAEGLFQGQNVAQLADVVTRTHDELASDNFKASEKYNSLLRITEKLLQVSARRAIFLNFFVFTQAIRVPSTYVKVLKNVGYPAIAIGFKKSERVTTENWWAYNAAVDYYQMQIGNRVQMEGSVQDIAELQHGKELLFAFAVNSEGDNRPAQAALDVMSSVNNFEINKSPDKLSKAFILKSVDRGTPNMRSAISQIIYSSRFKAIRSFSLSQQDKALNCMVATVETSNEMDNTVQILCLDQATGILQNEQNIIMENPTLLTSVTTSNGTLLGILTTKDGSRSDGLLEIWGQHGASSVLQFAKLHCLPAINAVSVDSITAGDSLTFLAVASGALRHTDYQGSVFIYRYSPMSQKFMKIETLRVNHPIQVKLQLLQSDELLAYVLSESATKNIQVFKYKGLSGWNLVHEFTSEDGKSIEVADFTSDGVYRAQLLVTSPSQTSIYAAEFMGLNTVIEESLESETVGLSSSSIIDVDNL
ncbi:Thrombospondin-type laminin G domain and EAR repeat-containing protein [Orchesella cincta]|uniref:Thrombospondin-type laminin G domain and EAR repeat-containing protein n=1 Tax=Orchesella cincta TaxID=48709 RepID=A0A1D2MFR0_ORCCI|nr:Thrombospondin-type laminin G domain and EAR repeat-containing protein [Orchesella cincta]